MGNEGSSSSSGWSSSYEANKREKEADNQYYGSSWYNNKYTTDNMGNEYKKSDDDQYYGSSWHR